jgi:hypothetical protein
MSETLASNTTYLPEIECEVRDGDAPWEKIVTVKGVDGKKQTFSVGKGMVEEVGGKKYVAVGVVNVNHQKGQVLIELPREADSGVGRIWMPLASFRKGAQS